MILVAPFGRTGHDSSRVIFGAAALGPMRPGAGRRRARPAAGPRRQPHRHRRRLRRLRAALGPWLAGHRDGFFLATKTGDRTGDGARASLERSLERLGSTGSTSSSSTTWSSPTSGRSPTAPGARSRPWRGPGRGPGPLHRRHRPRHPHRPHAPAQPGAPDFDSVLLPYSTRPCRTTPTGPTSRPCWRVRRPDVAVQTIKAVARRRWPEDAEGRRFAGTSRSPTWAPSSHAVRWVLGHAQPLLITSSDVALLPAALAAAARGARPRRPAPRRRPTPSAYEVTPCSTARSSSGSDPASGDRAPRVSGGDRGEQLLAIHLRAARDLLLLGQLAQLLAVRCSLSACRARRAAPCGPRAAGRPLAVVGGGRPAHRGNISFSSSSAWCSTFSISTFIFAIHPSVARLRSSTPRSGPWPRGAPRSPRRRCRRARRSARATSG